MTLLYFVTPAFDRYELSELCCDQRLDVIATLAEHGIEARCVVVADDANLDIARARGFDVVEQSNEWLGRKFNDGIEFAGKAGADFIVPIGSDSWIDPAYFLPQLAGNAVLTAEGYCHVTADRLGEARITHARGVGPFVFPRALLEPTRFRPSVEKTKSGVDSATVRGIIRKYGQITWQMRDLHPFQYIGFRVQPMITPFAQLMKYWGIEEHADPWRILAQHYPAPLVARAERLLIAQKAVDKATRDALRSRQHLGRVSSVSAGR